VSHLGSAILLVLALALAGNALADGDPASDVLYLQDVFLPYKAPSRAAADALRAAVTKANESGYRIKVAVIGSRFDLGTATALIGKPKQYARFLGAEVQFFYHGHLLVVMPNGFGTFYGPNSTAAADRLLAGLKAPGSKPDDLAGAAAGAVSLLTAKDTGRPRYRDTYPPNGQPLPFVLHAGGKLKLEYTVYDDSLRASATVEIVGKGRAVLLRKHRPLGLANGTPEAILWSPPPGYSHVTIQLCVSAKDAAGNVAKRLCVSVKLP
jgi:hypothetical protein